MPDEVLIVSDDFKVGAQIAGYVLREQVGTGGVAAVYRAYDVRLDRWVALKLLSPGIAPGDPFRRRLISESRAAAAIGHPHIIPVFEAGESDGVLFIAMRYVGGGDAGTLVRRLGPLDPVRAASIIAQVASALDAMHAAGLVHGRVRPASMLLDAAAADSPSPDHVYLSDFGFSAPQADDRGDLSALVRAACELLTGQQPSSGGEAGPGPAQPASLTSLRPDLPPAMARVLARALDESPGDRYQNCREFAADLLDACGLDRATPARPGPRAASLTAAGPPGAEIALARRRLAAYESVSPESVSPESVFPESVFPESAAGESAARESAMPVLYPADPPAPPYSAELPPPDSYQPAPYAPAPYAPGPQAPGPQAPGPRAPAPRAPAPSRRSPVIAAAVLVVILAVAGAAFLALHGGGATSPHAGLPPAAGGQANAGNPGSSAQSRHARRTSHADPSSRRKGIRHVRPAGKVSPTSASSPGSASPGPAPSPTSSAATVSAYIAAINAHDYARAWSLGGRSSSPSYAAFVQGFSSTASDALTIVSVDGNVVTVRLAARQTDGTVIAYQGTYTVDRGVIVASDIKQTS